MCIGWSLIAAGQGTRRIWRRLPMKQAFSSWARRPHGLHRSSGCHLGRGFWCVRAILGTPPQPRCGIEEMGATAPASKSQLSPSKSWSCGVIGSPFAHCGRRAACYVILTRASQEPLPFPTMTCEDLLSAMFFCRARLQSALDRFIH